VRLDILDIGLRTGLMGEGLRALKRTLRASISHPTCSNRRAGRGIYDRLIESDIVAFLETQTDQFDVTVSTDVFIYIGDLAGTLAGRAARSARRRAVPAFRWRLSTMVIFVLQPTLRYAHSIAYLTRLAEQTAWSWQQSSPTPCGAKRRGAVAGYNIVMRCC